MNALARERAAAVGLLVLCLAVLAVAFVMPRLDARRAASDRLATLQSALAGYQAETARHAAELATLEALKGEPRLARLFLPRQSPAVAAAALQQDLRRIVTESSGQLVSIQVVPPVPQEGPQPVRLRVQVRGDSAVLRAVLGAVEYDDRLLRVDELSVQRLAASRTLASAAGEHLDIRFQVTGYLQGAP